jgi:hypothetical protein
MISGGTWSGVKNRLARKLPSAGGLEDHEIENHEHHESSGGPQQPPQVGGTTECRRGGAFGVEQPDLPVQDLQGTTPKYASLRAVRRTYPPCVGWLEKKPIRIARAAAPPSETIATRMCANLSPA